MKTGSRTIFITTVQKRGAAVIEARGASSAASAANAALGSIKSIINPTPSGETFSNAMCSDGSYGIDEGLIFGFPLKATANPAASPKARNTTSSESKSSKPPSMNSAANATPSKTFCLNLRPTLSKPVDECRLLIFEGSHLCLQKSTMINRYSLLNHPVHNLTGDTSALDGFCCFFGSFAGFLGGIRLCRY